MKNKEDIILLEKFLKSEPRAKIGLALHLGYKTSLTIDKWRSRGKIPRAKIEKVIRYIERKK